MTIPQAIQDSMARYIEYGVKPGSCLTAIFENRLFEAYARADEEASKAIGEIVKHIYNYAPTSCWGSPQAVQSWIEKGGWYGKSDGTIGKS